MWSLKSTLDSSTSVSSNLSEDSSYKVLTFFLYNSLCNDRNILVLDKAEKALYKSDSHPFKSATVSPSCKNPAASSLNISTVSFKASSGLSAGLM